MTRSINYLNQVRLSFFFKTLAITSSFIVIPIMVNYLGKEQYGIWSTLLSIVSWMVMFDLGIGNGLRNKLAENIACNDIENATKYISTSYVLIGLIALVLMALLASVNAFIPWQNIFNTSILSNVEVKNIINITLGFVLLNFWLGLINQVLNGLQKTSVVVFNQFLSNFISLILIYILTKISVSSLLYLSTVYGISMVISSLSVSIWFYSKNKNLMPKLNLYTPKLVKSITTLGVQFFIIQMAVIVVFTTDKILITQLFGPEYVTDYDIVFKLFSIIIILHSLVSAPLWSAYTDAYKKNDFNWLRKTINQQLGVYVLLILSTISLIFLSPQIIKFWIGEEIHISNSLIFTMAMYVLITSWNSIFANFLNGVSIVKMQMYTSIYAILINIPISIFIVKYFETDIFGVVLGSIASLLLFSFLGPIKVFNILKDNQ
jgi:O-antigen/teichoic acid export membrane protein